mmetsp:Transcript_30624/g.76849  ORF Transcript_30624/g.76849 Transcript_30624/m.76849 type:complete len:478 (-) Transcript_30624:147-1580(-)
MSEEDTRTPDLFHNLGIEMRPLGKSNPETSGLLNDRSDDEAEDEILSDPSDSSSQVSLFEDKKTFYLNIGLNYLVTAVAESSRGLVLSSLWPYVKMLGGDKPFLGYVVGVFSIGRLLASLVFGYLSDRMTMRNVFLISLGVCAIGNLMYALAYYFDKEYLLLTRFVVGFGSGVVASARTHIAALTPPENRTKYLAWGAAAQFIGFAISPGIAIGLSYCNFSLLGLKVTQETAPGYLLFLMCVGSALAVFLKMASVSPQNTVGSKSGSLVPIPKRTIIIGSIVFITLNFVVRGMISVVETIGTPIFMKQRGLNPEDSDSQSDASLFFLLLGIGGLFVYFFIGYVSKHVSSTILLAGSILFLGGGCVVLVDYGGGWSFLQMLVGMAMIWSIGSPSSQVIILASFSALLGSRPQGAMMGLITASGSVARITLPVVAGQTTFAMSFLISLALCGLSMVLLIGFWFYTRREMAKQAMNDPLL